MYLGLVVIREHQVLVDILVFQDLVDIQEHQVLVEHQDSPVDLASQVIQEHLDLVDIQV